MFLVRQIGLAILAVAAIAVFFILEPAEGEPPPSISVFARDASDYTDLVSDALDSFELNDLRADTAPKQQVVNGWVVRDLLSIIALEGAQNVDALAVLAEQNELLYAAATTQEQRDDRPAALLVIAVLAIALWGATTAVAQPEPMITATGAAEPQTEFEASDNEAGLPQ